MNKTEAIEMLRKSLEQIPHLEKLQYNNEDYELWRDKLKQIITNILGKEDLETFTITNLPIPVIYFNTPSTKQQNYYINRLNEYRVNIKKIIRKYELLGTETTPIIAGGRTLKAFISHGKESMALSKIERFLRTLGIEPLIVKEQPNLGKTVDDKVNYYLDQADFVVILATGDDEIEGKLYPRQNVIHETGLAQKTHARKIIYLLENNTEFPSNIQPKVWESFDQQNIENVFQRIITELKAFGLLWVMKSQ